MADPSLSGFSVCYPISPCPVASRRLQRPCLLGCVSAESKQIPRFLGLLPKETKQTNKMLSGSFHLGPQAPD